MQSLSWLPIDIAAASILDLRDAEAQYINLVHPSPVSAGIITDTLSRLLNLQTISYANWVRELQGSASTEVEVSAPPALAPGRVEALRTNPALRLLEYFQSQERRQVSHHSAGRGAFDFPQVIDTHNALGGSETIRDLAHHQLNEGDVSRWLERWVGAGFLDAL